MGSSWALNRLGIVEAKVKAKVLLVGGTRGCDFFECGDCGLTAVTKLQYRSVMSCALWSSTLDQMD